MGDSIHLLTSPRHHPHTLARITNHEVLRSRFLNGIFVAWQGNGMVYVHQTRPHRVNQMEKTQFKPLADRHGMCESALSVVRESVSVCWLMHVVCSGGQTACPCSGFSSVNESLQTGVTIELRIVSGPLLSTPLRSVLHCPAAIRRCWTLHRPVAVSYALYVHKCYEGKSISKIQIAIEKKRMEIMTYKQHLFFNVISIQI
jgi:hypothetical protein